MNYFLRRHTTDTSPRRGGRGSRPYDDNGAPMEELPAHERPEYTNDENAGFSLRGSDTEAEAEEHEPMHGGGQQGSGESGPDSSPAQGAGLQESGGGEGAAAEYDFDAGLTELYNSLYAKLASYGVTSIPTLEALYGLFTSFLRPSVDEAIRLRNVRGAQNMAALDADAYSRGMGGSSYLSSMKAREMDDIEDDITALEGKYTATLAEHLYNALAAMQQLEASLYKAQLQYGGYGSSGSSGSGGHGRSGSSSSSSSSASAEAGAASGGYGHNKNGAYFDGVWYEGDFSYLEHPAGYNDYAEFIEKLTPAQVYLLFTSSRREWRMRRWQMQYNLTEFDYNELYDTYFVTPGGGGGGGEANWREMLY